MPVRQTIPLILCLAIAPGLWAAGPTETAGRSPLPHPEILQPAGTAAQPVAEPATAGEPRPSIPTAASEEKEIAARDGRKVATATATGQKTETAPRGSGGWSLMRDMWPLLTVLLLIGGMAMVLRRYMPARRLLGGSDVLKIVARTHVSPKQQLVLVKLGRRLVLLGVSPERISSLSTVEDSDQVAMLLGEIASGQPGSISSAFASSVEDEREAYAGDVSDGDETEATRGQVRGLLQKVRSLAGKGA